MSAWETLVHDRSMFLQLCLWMLLLLSACSPTGHAKYSSPPEVVIPLRVTDHTRYDISPDWLSYSLHIGGVRHIITMKPTKPFISRNFLLLTYSDQGDVIEEQPFVQNDCYYHGDVDGDPESMVIINTCLGTLQGTLLINGTLYEIMPKNPISTFEHLVYKIDVEDSESLSMRCGITEEEIARHRKIQKSKDSTLMQGQYENWWTHHYYVEYYVVIDNKQYVNRSKNASKCTQELVEILFNMNAFLLQIDTELIFRGMEIWSQKNHLNISVSAKALRNHFEDWVKLYVKKSNDIAHLFVRHYYDNEYGASDIGGVCTVFKVGVISCIRDSIIEVALIATHHMGHSLGMAHDVKYCTCGLTRCIMNHRVITSPKFSNCSYLNMKYDLLPKTCLNNNQYENLKLSVNFCGNNLVEEGEQCDCGSSESCEKDECCTPHCVLKSDAQCSIGLCCKDCKFIPKGTVCREKKNECDLPEWCNGTSAECTEDVYMEDGSPCKDGGYCYKMECNNREEHCQRLFGKSAKNADMTCYREVNTIGDRFGNCGNDTQNYSRCENDDVLCGRIQCVNVKEIPQKRSHETVHWIRLNDTTCWSMDYHFGINREDNGVVRDGTPCGPDSMCIRRRCVYKSVWLSNCSTKCNNQGVCNNKHYCHCHEEWAPRGCLSGSVDSGLPTKINYRPRKVGKRLKMTLLIIPSLLLVVLISIIIIIIKQKLHGKPNTTEQRLVPESSEQALSNEIKPANSPKTKVQKKVRNEQRRKKQSQKVFTL